MKKKKVISSSNMQSKLPIGSTLIVALALDYWQAPYWFIVMVAFFYLIGWIQIIIDMTNQEVVDIFDEKDKFTTNLEFNDKLKEAIHYSEKAKSLRK
jgi:hypothetical protein